MSTRLVILGILRQGPLHGYEIKHIIEERLGDWTSIAFGSIYFALGKLAEEGMIRRAGTEKKGRRPSRSIYEVTEAGRSEFLRLLRETWREVQRQYFTVDIALAFWDALPQKEIAGYLDQRKLQLESGLRHLETHQEEQMAKDRIPSIAAFIFEHTRRHVTAELTWTKELLGELTS